MKKVINIILWAAFSIFLFVWLFIGILLLDGNYDFLVAAWIAAVTVGICAICVIIRAFLSIEKCTKCGKRIFEKANYCPHCGFKHDS